MKNSFTSLDVFDAIAQLMLCIWFSASTVHVFVTSKSN